MADSHTQRVAIYRKPTPRKHQCGKRSRSQNFQARFRSVAIMATASDASDKFSTAMRFQEQHDTLAHGELHTHLNETRVAFHGCVCKKKASNACHCFCIHRYSTRCAQQCIDMARRSAFRKVVESCTICHNYSVLHMPAPDRKNQCKYVPRYA